MIIQNLVVRETASEELKDIYICILNATTLNIRWSKYIYHCIKFKNIFLQSIPTSFCKEHFKFISINCGAVFKHWLIMQFETKPNSTNYKISKS